MFSSDVNTYEVYAVNGQAAVSEHVFSGRLYVGDAEVMSYGDVEGTGASGTAYMIYNDDTHTITLELTNFSYSGAGHVSGNDNGVIWYEAPSGGSGENLVISLSGVNTLVNNDAAYNSGCGYGIYYSGDKALTINGAGSLAVSFVDSQTAREKRDGIFMNYGSLSLTGSPTVRAIGGYARESLGVYAPTAGSVTVSGGSLYAEGVNTTAYESRGIKANLKVNGGTVTAKASNNLNSTQGDAWGVQGNVELSSGSLTASGTSQYRTGKGITGTVKVDSGSMIADGSTSAINASSPTLPGSGYTILSSSSQDGTAAKPASASYNTYKYLSVIPNNSHTHSVDGHTVVFNQWSSTNSLPNAAGFYYLNSDVTLANTWYPNGTVNLCLNGHNITTNSSTTLIQVSSGATLNLFNCGSSGTISGGSIGVEVASGGTFNMYGGEISRNNQGVYVNQGGAFSVSGSPTISGNTTNNVYLQSGTKINVAGTLSSSARIGVTLAGETGTFTSGAGFATTAAARGVFSSDNDTYSVYKPPSGEAKIDVQAVAEVTINDVTTPYASIHEAMTAALAAETAEASLLANVTTNYYYNVNNNLTLALNGKTFTCANNSGVAAFEVGNSNANASFTLRGGTLAVRYYLHGILLRSGTLGTSSCDVCTTQSGYAPVYVRGGFAEISGTTLEVARYHALYVFTPATGAPLPERRSA